jgi:hypothetical protein
VSRAIGAFVTAFAIVVAHAVPVRAQQDVPVVQAEERRARLELVVLGGWMGGSDLGTTEASMITNQVPTGATTALFTTSTSIGAAPVVEGRLGLRIGGGWYVETGLGYARPDFRVNVSADVEGAPDVTATTSLSQYIVDGALQYRWTRRRVSPFVMGGGGYLRQLDAPRTTASTGAVYYGGGGVVVRLAPDHRGFWGHVALRADARVVWLRDGIILDDQRSPTFSVTGGIVAGW